MGVEVLDSTLEVVDEALVEERFDDDAAVKPPKSDIDARRRLEDKLEQLRLEKELREYDFDI
ncbi:hypothetical protein DWB84_16795 [Saccharophagus sp. K07]|jgi:hypothetical protein|uniref:PA3496 family putative envelope integrity protein n=1 Tax=Saccharophagus sp. K07 TaxID=2283636 RepID=UPI0016520A65|nr:hypothetical protein [Saccharophagus sp. K07]MBC6907101.1 hypothetical protein [Saccharophagus sp. K07]